jgi:hypothetical protein
MSIRISFDPNSAFSQVAGHIANDGHLLALEGFITLIQALCSITTRLEEEIVYLSYHEGPESSLVQMRLAITDAWAVVDNAHRAIELVELTNLIQFTVVEKALIENLKLIRNSYQHLNDRIGEHFLRDGTSIFGKLTWYYLSKEVLPENKGYWMKILVPGTSLSHKGKVTDTLRLITRSSFTNNFCHLIIHYVIKRKRNDPTMEEIRVELDDVVMLLNSILAQMETKSIPLLQIIEEKRNQDPENSNKKGAQPFTVTIAINQ